MASAASASLRPPPSAYTSRPDVWEQKKQRFRIAFSCVRVEGLTSVMRPPLRCGRLPRHKLLVLVFFQQKKQRSRIAFSCVRVEGLTSVMRPPPRCDRLPRHTLLVLMFGNKKSNAFALLFHVSGWRDSNPHARASDPKSDMSTNFTTPGCRYGISTIGGREYTTFF